MKLTGDLKKKVEQTQTKEEAKDAIKKAGMLLTDDELEQVAGGGEGDDPKGGYKYICTTCGGECCFDFIVENPPCPSCGNSTLQEADRKYQLGPWKPIGL